MDTNIFLVESPFQLMCSIEANEYFNKYKSILVIKNVANERSNQLMEWIISNYYNKWDKVIVCNLQNNTLRDYFFMNLIRKIKNRYSVNYIFVGYPETRNFQWFCEQIDNKGCFVLDDGTKTIYLQNQFMYHKDYLQKSDIYIMQNNSMYEKIKKLKNIVKLFSMKYLFNLNKSNPIKYNLFTCFNLKINNEQLIIKNDFSYIKSVFLDYKVIYDEVYFFGSPLSEVEIISLDLEIEFLKKVFNYYKDKNLKFIYIPHREDSLNKINKIKQFCNILYLDTIAEIALMTNKQLPAFIASFISTVLFTLPKIYNFKNVTSFKIPYKYVIRDDRKKSINYTYEALKKENIQIIDLYQEIIEE